MVHHMSTIVKREESASRNKSHLLQNRAGMALMPHKASGSFCLVTRAPFKRPLCWLNVNRRKVGRSRIQVSGRLIIFRRSDISQLKTMSCSEQHMVYFGQAEPHVSVLNFTFNRYFPLFLFFL